MLQFLEKGDRGRGEGNDKSSLSLLFLFSSVFFFGGGGGVWEVEMDRIWDSNGV